MILFIVDIIDSIELIQRYVRTITKEEFYQNKLIQDAVIRRLEIIGESVKNIPEDFRRNYPNVPWKTIAGLRDILIHTYFGVIIERVWGVIQKNLPETKKQMVEIRQDIEK